MSGSRIVFVVTGSIAAFKAAQVVSRLVQNGHEVRVVATQAALRFVGTATFEGLTGHPVLSDLWETGRAMDHIHLGRWADLGVICPASASTIAHMSHGLSDDLVGALTLAWPRSKPLHLFPAMNREMLSHPATNANLAAIASAGVLVHPTAGGNLACGEVGAGRLLEPDEIVSLILPRNLGRLLLTAGATREPIDGIRFLSNVSTGRTGATLADRLAAKGWEITFMHGHGSVQSASASKRMLFGSFASLDNSLRQELATHHYRAVIHAAAVGDYSVSSVNGSAADEHVKLASGRELELHLRANHKILPHLKACSANPDIAVIGFKLTLNQSEERCVQIARALLSASVDAVVANDWSRISSERHPGHLVLSTGATPFDTTNELADLLHKNLIPPE